MITTDTLEGTIDDRLSFHYDVFTDVLYLRLLDAFDVPALGDITDEGDILLREQATDRVVGLTVVSWWKRFGHGTPPDLISGIENLIEPLAKKVISHGGNFDAAFP